MLTRANTEEYYSVSKPLYYFFTCTYGGGPAIVVNSLFNTSLVQPSLNILSEEEKERKEERQLEDGIVGLHNNTFFCYMNACLQCLLAIAPLRDFFLSRSFLSDKHRQRRKNNFEYHLKFEEFYATCFSKSSQSKRWVVNPELKKLVRRKFDPVAQHDSHEFMLYIFEQLQDELTPKHSGWDGSDPRKPLRQACEEY